MGLNVLNLDQKMYINRYSFLNSQNSHADLKALCFADLLINLPTCLLEGPKGKYNLHYGDILGPPHGIPAAVIANKN